MNLKKSLIVVVGPTSSGKSELAVKLARRFNGEIISADSRQIYKGMNLGSGKVPGIWKKEGNHGKKVYLYKGVPHYLIDEANPKRQYSVARFQKEAKKVIIALLKRGKQPIICGGTAHWIDALVYEQTLPAVKPDAKLRAKLSKLSTEQLFKKLQGLDPERAADIDAKNPRRLIRAVEIVMLTGKPVPKSKLSNHYEAQWLGLNPSQTKLETQIKKRLKARLKQGMLAEVKKLRANGLSWKRLESFGLEYKFCALQLQGKLSHSEMEVQLFTAIRQYVKRQMTWWKRNKEILWFEDSKKALR